MMRQQLVWKEQFAVAAQINPLKPTPGQKALVYGATGAIGSSYVQFLKFYGVSVTAVCRGENRELVNSLGADKVVDYAMEDFTKDSEQYDFVFDAVGKSRFFQMQEATKGERRLYFIGWVDQPFSGNDHTTSGWQKSLFLLCFSNYIRA